jgi:hypothetical protein
MRSQRQCEQFVLGSFLLMLSTLSLSAQSNTSNGGYSYGLYGTPGLIDMPTAQSADDAEIAATVSNFAGTTRTTLSFQISPRLSGSFRYSNIKNASDVGGAGLFDRSFDLQYGLIDEGPNWPSVAIGLRDIIGTGVYSSEYIVASKQIAPAFQVTAGMGWGRLGSSEGFSNPLGVLDARFETRPDGFTGTGGQIESARWFRGDAALFGGVKWQATDELSLMVEYSSDAYQPERTPQRDLFERDSPLNFGLAYAFANGTALQAHYLYGSEFGAGLTFTLNPKTPAVYGGAGQRPTPVEPQDPEDIASLEWTRQSGAPEILRSNLQQSLQAEGITLEAATFAPTSATVLVRNNTYSAGSEVIGRTARIMARLLPASVQDFTIVPVESGIRTAAIRIARADLEVLEFAHGNVSQSFARAQLADGASAGNDATYIDDLYPTFQWRLGPYVSASYFDPDSPLRADIGIELSATYSITPGLLLAGNLRKRIGGNISEGGESNSIIQRVRSDAPLYASQGDPSLTRLTADYKTNLGGDLYGRMTVGYLESMYGGLSAETLWKPVDSALGLGLEVNYARQRDFDQMFGFQDYDVVTGHISAYYAFENNFHAQLDVGRYLAGDYGATLALDREFDNGWRVGAFATFTDVSFDDFGEGSFDKGLRFSVPLEYFIGTPTKQVSRSTIRPLTRDGGARLNVEGRLYETVRGFHTNDLEGNWGRFWR